MSAYVSNPGVSLLLASLAELNAAIGELLRQLNDERPIRRLGVTRRALFEELDRPNLNSRCRGSYCFAEWRVRRVGVDYPLTYGSVRSILDNKLDRQAAQRPPANGVPILHPNIRGPRYYH